MADGRGLNDVSHKRLVQHPDTCGHGRQVNAVLWSLVHRRQGLGRAHTWDAVGGSTILGAIVAPGGPAGS